MPPPQNQNTQDDRRELQRAEERLMAARIPAYPLGGFGQAENRPQVDQQAADDDGAAELHQATGAGAGGCFARFGQKDEEEDKKKEEGEDLVDEAGEQDVVGRVGRFVVAFGIADQARADHLGDGGDDVAGDEEPEDELLLEAEGAQILAEGVDQRGEGCVDGGGEEDGSDDDEEVLDDEVDDFVWVPHGGRRGLQAECIAYDFEDGGQE